MPNWDISERELVEFEQAIEDACFLASPDPLRYDVPSAPQGEHKRPVYFRSSDCGLVLSFDGSWNAYLDNTQGYNVGRQRWYVPKRSALIGRVGRELQTPMQKRLSNQPGGRVFLYRTGVWRSPEGHGRTRVAQFSLARASYLLLDDCSPAPLALGGTSPRKQSKKQPPNEEL